MNYRSLTISLLLLLGFCTPFFTTAQDIFTRGLVYQEPAMKTVIVKEANSFSAPDTNLVFDIYYPPLFNQKSNLPVVIFNNGGSLELHRWGIYKDWAKLLAARGMIAVNYQARPNKGLMDGEALIDHLARNAMALNIDATRMGMWTCSGNARTGMRLAYKTRPDLIKTLVIYYGGPDSLGQLRQDLPTLMVRAGLDAQFLNTGIDNFIQAALQQDAQIELINYVKGIHAFDVFQPAEEANDIIKKTVSFFEENLRNPPTDKSYVLTNKNFMWLIMNNLLPKAMEEFRRARTMYRADSLFQPFYNAVIREDVLIANAYFLLNNRRQGDAVEVFKLAVETYPESPNAYESLSEAYDVTGNKEEALRNAELTLEKLPAVRNLNENFKQTIKRSAEERISRLRERLGSKLPPKRAHHELVYDEGTKTILLTAGSTPLNGGSSFEFFNDLWRFDGKEWKQTGSAGDRRSGIRMAYDSKRKKIFSFGGFSGSSSLADLRVLEDGEWKILSNLPDMNAAEPGFVYDASRDRLIAFGGSGGRNQLNGTTWEWDGLSWKKFEGNGPGPRQAFAMVYDSKRKKTVLYGGMNAEGKPYEDGIWEFDGNTWTNIPATGAGPGPRSSPGFAYDSKRGVFVIFSGRRDGSNQTDTWGWNGKEWKLLASDGPSFRYMGYMAYDKARDRIVLFGGRPGWPNDVNDTWEWDGNKWTEIR